MSSKPYDPNDPEDVRSVYGALHFIRSMIKSGMNLKKAEKALLDKIVVYTNKELE